MHSGALIADVLTVAQMQACEQDYIAGGIPGARLMEVAGRAVGDHISQRSAPPARVAVLCGPGNNGGDGFVVARILKNRGYQVFVYALGKRSALSGDAKAMADLWEGPIHPASAFRPNEADVIVDALFGTGLARPVSGVAATLIAQSNNSSARLLVAVDIPSGIAGDSGSEMGLAFRADLTITFHALKPGHLLVPGRYRCGEVIVADIGLGKDANVRGRELAGGPAVEVNQAAATMARIGQNPGNHKYDKGHALVLAGGLESVGAARLAARAALRSGAGLVTLGVPPLALLAHASRTPDALMLRGCDGAKGLSGLLADKRRNAVVIGPAYGVGKQTCEAVATVLSSGRVVVIDADALTSFAGDMESLASLTKASGRAILTPHEGEFSRMARNSLESALEPGHPVSKFPGFSNDSKLFRALAAASFFGAVVVLKGPDTVIAAPDGRAAINTNAPPWLGTAGSGDVLAGIIAGLAAQGLDMFAASCAGVWLHGEAGQIAGRGMIADDLPEAIRARLRTK